MTVVIPGDPLPLDPAVNITLGPGIHKLPKSHAIIPVNAGLLHSKINSKHSNQVIYLDLESKRYIPQANDLVLGIVSGVIGENYKLTLQPFSSPVMLPMMAFPNATKKNRPNLNEGDAVYARVATLIPELETELLCVDARTGKEGGFGVLDTAGFVFDVKQSFARELLFNAQLVFLEKLATRCQFEIAVGINGKVWLKCSSSTTPLNSGDNSRDVEMKTDETSDKLLLNPTDLKTTLAAVNYLKKCQVNQSMSLDEIASLCFKGL